jgi:3-hydroxy-9,10-secoandrosta-1,3,5(10)-triene-9,17-dione monooxygenase reductase component
MEVDEFRSIMRNLAAGVTIVTTSFEGTDYGMTATSFNSVAIDPITVQVSLSHESRTYKAVIGSGIFGVNVLSADQEGVAKTFAQKSDDQFNDVPTEKGTSGVPLIEGAIARLECRVTESIPRGDHTLFMGEVLGGSHLERPPLLYFQGDYYRLTKEDS